MAQPKVPALLHKMSMSAQKAWYKKHGMDMPSADDKGRSAAAAKKVKVEPRKELKAEPTSVRAINIARQSGYYAKGGRQPIGAGGSGGSNVMAGAGQSTAKDIRAGIKAGFNPKVSLDPYESERAKKTGPRSLNVKMKKESVDEAYAKVKQINKQKLKNYVRGLGTKAVIAGKVPFDQVNSPLRAGRKALKQEEVQIDEVTKKEAESTLGGPTKEKPKMPPGKQPAGYRYVRGLARKAMKAGLKKEEVSVDEEKKPDASMAMTNQLKMKAISDKDKRTLGKVAALMAAQKKSDKKNMKEESEMKYIEEKLTAADPASKWISDFVKSDNPKFAGKSKKERINQALGAYYAATRGKNEQLEFLESKMEKDSKEEMEDDEDENEMEDDEDEEEDDEDEEKSMNERYMGFSKLKASIAAKGGARDPAAVAAAIGRKKYGKKKFQAAAAAGKKLGEEVEQIDELKKSTLASYVKKATRDVASASRLQRGYETDAIKSEFPPVQRGSELAAKNMRKFAGKRSTGIAKAVDKLAKEEVESVEEGFDPDPKDIAAYLVDKHGKGKVTKDHVNAYERNRDSNRAIDKEAVMKHVQKMAEAMDPVGREDKDVDNDGDSDKTDLYLSKRRKAISSAIRKKVSDKMGK